MANEPGKSDYHIAAVDRALNVLEALGSQPGQSLASLTKMLGMTKTIIFRHLQTLQDRGFVYRDPDLGVYYLGHRIGVLGERVGRIGSLLHAARPIMDEARDRTSENINLIIREGLNSRVILSRPGRYNVQVLAPVGELGPLYAGGGSLCLLAFATQPIIDAVLSSPLTKIASETVTDRDELGELLEKIRRQGHNISLNDLYEGAFAIAAPIVGPDGTVSAAVSISGAMARLKPEQQQFYIRAACEAAEAIASKLKLSGLV